MAAEMNTVVEGPLKYRDGKKWKARYCVIKKPSPVADRLLVSLYKEQKDVSHKDSQPKSTFVVEDYYGIEADLTVDKENCVMALICQKSVSVFAFHHREGMLHFEISIRRSMGQDHQYPVRLYKIPTHSKLPLGKAQLHIQGQKFCLTAHSPPKILLSWKIPELRRYGIVDGRFMFEGGSMCGKGSGVHGFESYQAEEINRNFQSSGRFPTRKQPLMWRKNKSQDHDSHTSEYQKFLDNAEQDIRVQERMRSKRHSVGVLDYRQAVEMVEKKRLMSIENVDKERFTRIYDIPPQLVRKVDSDPSIPEANDEEFSHDERLADISNKNMGDTSLSNRNNMDKNRSNRNSGDGSRSNRNSGDGSRSNRNSGDGSRSNRNSGDGPRSNRNSGDGTRSNRNSGDGTRSNRNSGDGRRSKRNSMEGSRSNRNSSDSSHSSRSSGEGSRYRPRRFSGETSHSYWHSDIAHRTSLALRRSLDNILAGNQNWVEDLDGEFKENSLSRSNLYKSTSALCTRLSESDSVLIEDEVVQARSGSVLLDDEDVYIQSCVKDEAIPNQPSSILIEDMLSETPSDSVFFDDKNDLVQPDMKDEMLQTEITIKDEVSADQLNTENKGAVKSAENDLKQKVDVDSHSGYINMCGKMEHTKSDSLPSSGMEENVPVQSEDLQTLIKKKEESLLECSPLDCMLKDAELKISLDSLACSLTSEDKIYKGNADLEELAEQEEILQHEMDLLDEMLEVCVNEKVNTLQHGGDTRKFQGFADALSTLTIDTCWTEDEGKSVISRSNQFRHTDSMGAMLSPNLTSKVSRIPSCSKLVAPLPYVNLDKYDLGVHVCDHVDVSKVPVVRRGFSYDNLMSASKPSKDGQSFRTKSLSCSDSSGGSANLSPDAFMKKPPPLPPKTVKEESPPPKLPPKGPNLLRRQRGTSTLFSLPGEDSQSKIKQPKVVVSRSGVRGEANPQYQSPRSVPTRIPKPVPPVPQPEEAYMLMSDFPTKAVSPNRAVLNCPSVEEVSEDDPKAGYMEMSAILDTPPPVLPKCTSGPEIHRATKIPQVMRSQSVRTTVEDSRRPKLLHSQSADPSTEVNTNYVEMLAAKPVENITADEDSKAAMPFPDLITVQSYRSSQKIELTVIGESNNSNNNPTLNNSNGGEKLDSSSTSNKSLSFFSRFIQRTKSKDRKSPVCSPDIITDMSKSGTALNKNKSDDSLPVPKVTSRSASICYQNNTNLLAPPLGTDRKRSSSFPNAAVFMETMQTEDKNGTVSTGKTKDKMDKRESQSEDTLLALIEKESHKDPEEVFGSYWSVNPVEITCKSSCNEKQDVETLGSENSELSNATVESSPHVEENSSVELPSDTTVEQKDVADTLQKKLPVLTLPQNIPSAFLKETEEPGLTEKEQPVQSNSDTSCSESPQTDDEKLLALAKASKQGSVSCELDGTVVIGAGGKLSASEQAAAIAEYVTGLAPFIPPKTRLHYPGGLSPVIEGLASPPSQLRPLQSMSGSSDTKLDKGHSDDGKGKERLSKAAWRKQKARETLRIEAPVQDENGNIWIPRGSLKKFEPVTGHGVSGDDGMNTANRRNDTVNEVKEHLDALSLTSHGSSAGSPGGIRAEDTPLRSSPASTTLRPRSGKEYHRIDRRRLTDDHSPSSCPITPQSPSTGSIFTFDTPGSPSIRSILSRDGESPASSPSIMRGTYPCHSYVNLGKGQDSRPNLYVNIDMTPPNSPFRRTHMPLEQIDPQLNYAEIDLSQAGSDRSRKSKKGVQKAATIEYAMIDMVATAAVSKTRKEQDSLRCSGRKFSAPASVIVKDRRPLGSGSFRDKDRARKLSTSSVESNG